MTTESKPRRIHSLRVENVLAVEHVEIQFRENGITIVAGLNGAGKSSVLHAVELVLQYLAAKNRVAFPILRRGKSEGISELDLGEGLVVSRRFTEAGKAELVVRVNKKRQPAPTSFLEAIRPPTLLDPLAFARMDPAARRQLMIEIGGLGEELGAINVEIVAAEDVRRDAGRDSKRLAASYQVLPEAPDETPDERVSAVELTAELERVQEEARAYRAAGTNVDDLAGRAADAAQRNDSLENHRILLR